MMGTRRTYFSSRLNYISSVYITSILWIISIGCITADFDPPLITPDEPDITKLPSESVQFSCQATEPIYWKPFDEFAGTQNIRGSYNPSTDLYESVIELNQIDYLYVGYYYCIKNSSNIDDGLESLVKNGQAAEIYLYVEDPQHPLVDVPYPVLFGSQFTDIVIPCKPTSKMWTTQLIKEGDESHQFESTFSPTDGYRIALRELTDGGNYQCHSKHDLVGEHDIHFTVHVDPGTQFVNKPMIISKTDSYGIEGESLELSCSVEVGLGTKLEMTWLLPNNNISRKEERTQTIEPHLEKIEKSLQNYLAVGKLIVHNLDKQKDEGLYKCMVRDHLGNGNSDTLIVKKILGPGESYITISEPAGRYKSEVTSNRTEVKWYVKYWGHPFPTLVWRDIRGNDIPWSAEDGKFEATKENRSTTLKIRNPRIEDSGTYTLYATNGKIEEKKEFQLLVKEKPQVSMNNKSVKPGEKVVMTCDIFGYPKSTVSWSFIPCHQLEFNTKSCDENQKTTFTDELIETIKKGTFNQTSTINFIPDTTGVVICEAKNTQGIGQARANVNVNDLDDDFMIECNNELPISIGDEVSVLCGAAAHKYATDLKWFKDDIEVQNSDDVQIIPHDTQYSHRKELRWKSVSATAAGKYVCKANVIKDDSEETKTWHLNVVPPKMPEIDANFNSGKIIEHLLGEPLELRCFSSGIPKPYLTWFKDDDEIPTDRNDSRIRLNDDNTVLNIKYTKPEDQGKYKCVAKSRVGSVARETALKITNVPSVSLAVIVGVIGVILVLVICTIYLCVRIRRERRLFRELKAAGLAHFEEGNVESMNPDLALDEQADLLPYDKKYEFPREKLKLGKQLGAGAFGVVIKGVAQGIQPYEDETTVAVKMVKKMADNEVMRALVSELKIMVHLGQHLNVVNLLGAVTKNIAQREVMVIVEYCRFGNLQNFLVKHRPYFIDQIVRDKDIIDPSIQTRDPRWSNDSGYSYFNRPETDRQSVVNSAYIRHTNPGDFFPGGMDSANTEATLLSRNTLPGGEDNLVMSNNSTQPAWRSNYQSDYKGPSRSVTTTDLLCWAFQVSRGMEYLASRKVLHGDLAARNILLCDDNVVKICDFGLARSMYKTDNYRKKGEAPLPFKWLALESISDQVFSTYSDVWSFGIFMWELFSLGKVPYPGMDADQALYFKLKDGYRMEKPDHATQDIYDIMLSCWCAHAESRPLFDELEKNISKLLESGVAEHYIDLNEPYLKSNISNFNSGQTDYIALMGAPDCQAPGLPNNYVNSTVIAMQNASDPSPHSDYLAMSPPIEINSPVPGGVDTHDSHFPFAAINSPTTVNNLNAIENSLKLRNKISNIPEEIPMLKRSNQSFNSDSDSELNTSDILKSDTVTNSPRKNPNVLNTMADNYVNVPSTIITPKKDAVSNPGYVTVSNVHETRT